MYVKHMDASHFHMCTQWHLSYYAISHIPILPSHQSHRLYTHRTTAAFKTLAAEHLATQKKKMYPLPIHRDAKTCGPHTIITDLMHAAGLPVTVTDPEDPNAEMEAWATLEEQLAAFKAADKYTRLSNELIYENVYARIWGYTEVSFHHIFCFFVHIAIHAIHAT